MPAERSGLSVEHVSHEFAHPGHGRLRVVDDVSFEVPAGEFLAIVGPSGCGKTTLLNMLAGLVRPTTGAVYRGDTKVAGVDSSVGYMFARSALLPWRPALANVELGLELRGVPRRDRRRTATALLTQVGLAEFIQAYPAELSQGMRQRVSLARTLAVDPANLFMDEPFAALDAQTRVLMQQVFEGVWEGSGKTVLWVTHDLTEAVALADRVLVMSARPGRVKAEFAVDFPRPRIIADLRFDSSFQRLSELVWETLRDEIAAI